MSLCCSPAGQRKTLVPLRVSVPMAANHWAAFLDDGGHIGEGLHVIHAGGFCPRDLPSRIGRTWSRHAPFTSMEAEAVSSPDKAPPGLDLQMEIEATAKDIIPDEGQLGHVLYGLFSFLIARDTRRT